VDGGLRGPGDEECEEPDEPEGGALICFSCPQVNCGRMDPAGPKQAKLLFLLVKNKSGGVVTVKSGGGRAVRVEVWREVLRNGLGGIWGW
jgi:hypothetical protein